MLTSIKIALLVVCGLTIEQVQEIETLFELADDAGDCCVQGGSREMGIVFGGLNRVYLYKDDSIKVSKFHCSDHFLEVAGTLGYTIG
jgi:hypothetical protein